MRSRHRRIADEVGCILADVYAAHESLPIFRIRQPGVTAENDLCAIVLYKRDPRDMRVNAMTAAMLQGKTFRRLEQDDGKTTIWIEVKA